METYFPAHIKITEHGETKEEVSQTVREHCRNTARYAAMAVEGQGLKESAYLAGLVHDMGKYTLKFRNYLTKAVHGETVQRGSVNHTFAGVKYLLEQYHQGEDAYQKIVSELLAYAVGAHHGLFDCVGEGGSNGFEHRKEKKEIDYAEAAEHFLMDCAGQEELDSRFLAAKEELQGILIRIFEMTEESSKFYNEESLFYVGILERLLVSAVIAGDRRDTAEFMGDIPFPVSMEQEERTAFWGERLKRVEKKLDELPRTSEIDCARKEISDCCRAFAEKPAGVYRLNVPTGSGKTLSSLRYALAHAEKWGKKRIIFTSPLLSILEQNAAVIRAYVQDDKNILEHHSNVVKTGFTEEELDEKELLEETWEAPVILTTMVQLLNTMFSGKTTCVRRFHSLCDSVVVIDEIQTLPGNLLSLFSLMVNFLTGICQTTIVLCSATQPCMEAIKHPLHGPVQNMVPFRTEWWKPFQRTQLFYMGSMSLEEMAGFSKGLLEEAQSLLIVCNKKEEAEQLYRLLDGGEYHLAHLSAAMCMAHRKNVLKWLRGLLGTKGEKVACISTQVIEAGVDISFQRVIRLTAGMDSVIQAAGRCNRNAEAGKDVVVPVYLISCKEEKLSRLPDIQRGKDATLALLNEWETCPEQHCGDLYSEEAISFYYRRFYQDLKNGYTEDIVSCQGEKTALFDLLSENGYFAKRKVPKIEDYTVRQAFGLAGKLFQVFGEDTTDVIVPYEEGKELAAALDGEQAKRSISYARELLEKAKPYTISLYQYQVEKLQKEKALHRHGCGAFSLTGHYNENTGFSMEEETLEFWEV